ncbi:prepilin-type N-terminal cleavage/methylation domain-containing protein [Halomonas sp. MCCC 1A17488]|uniref:Type II secretion system protein H n=1 Tax=Billgrantia sulfidoxydans TaxID=2733484 RepID=A0ABX7W8T6_9GAMM|nr:MULTISPECIES: GspH/FimT family pseudopilin [Halomonas]MCE8018460.1 prepilin-type N-terminal cleavage/methylation domain-containing protein [Halomonas sp. MCCC 1A17488]MCG3241793.1 prepilin-type N-terminal cleavage/methylation domain-containing protein [Halomonas sp. MCCC 1A17488]QPP49161.1 GspH/FimT family pseudopilin [Halomonas sp. SS10-MC5]QTP56495.1 prepilin-type N-terminal cleavage/methylation domain-containing protein [Halomonas sulfidoxydans]
MDAAHASPSAALRQRGLTLIELLVVIAVASVLLGWAVPGLQAMSARHEVTAEAHRLRVALSLGRNTAITRRTPVIVCPSPDHRRCVMDDWSAPLAIVLGPLAGNEFSESALLRVIEANRGVRVSYRQDGKPVRYGALGRPAGHNGTFRICGRHEQGAQLVLSNFGRVRAGSAIDC